MIIDAHHHLWQIGHNDHIWPTADLKAIYRDFGVEDLKAVTGGVGVTGTVLVQSQPSEIDTLWLLKVAADSPLIQGVVGWTDMLAPDAPMRIAYLADQPKFKGLRPMLQGLEDDAWILQPALKPALNAMVAHKLSLDALVFTRHLPFIRQLAHDYPDLPIVIDHAAKPAVAHRYSHPEATRLWRDQMTTLARQPNVMVKLSGLPTEMSAGQENDELIPYLDHLLETFGPQRMMWGSDWPVVLLNRPYRSWFEWVRTQLDRSSDADKTHIFATTARTFYRLPA